MVKKQGNLKLVFLIFIIMELVLVILSSRFQKTLQIGFKDGKFIFRNAPYHYDLQEKITEDFQRDEYLLLKTKVQLHDINDFSKFTQYITGKDPVMMKVFSLLNEDIQASLNHPAGKYTDQFKGKLINEFNKSVISGNKLYEPQFLDYISADTPEQKYLINLLKSNPKKLSNLDNARLNRILIDQVIPENVLNRQVALPRIYGSFTVYNFFRRVFGEASAMGAFYLIRMLLIVDLIFIFLLVLVKRTIGSKPSKGQIIFEMVYGTFEDFVNDTLGKERTHFTPYIVTIFLFVWMCNMVGMIPIPGFMEPTRNINVPLGLGIVVIIVVHFTAIKVKGLWKHLENYLNPIKNPLAALDIVSEFSKVISISFRLFGNILGGAIIIVVVSSLVNYIVFPVGLNLFFGIFVGTVQAFVFTMLALTYIGVEITE